MTVKVFSESGEEIDALTADEVAEIQARADKAQELETKVADLQKEVDLAKEESNPNWKEARAKMDKLQGFIKEKGFELNADGTIKDSQEIDPNKLKDEVRNEIRAEQFKEAKDELLEEYDDTTKPLVEKYISKFMSGEEANLKNLRAAFKDAEKLLGIGESIKRSGSINGAPPKFDTSGKSFSDTEEGTEMAKQLFGENSFINKK